MTVDRVTTLRIPTRGPYDLGSVASMGFGHRDERFDGVMRLAFCVDESPAGPYETQVGVAVRQIGDELELTIEGNADPAVVSCQVARVVSVDHDGDAFADLGRRDPVVGRLQAQLPGFRPSLFYSPYEAAVWSIVSARRPRAQGIRLRQRLIETAGRTVEVAGEAVGVVPTPSQLSRVESVPGLPADRIPRLHAVAAAAARGELDVARLHELGPDRASADLQRLPGIGPFYASLIVVRGSGFADVPVLTEARARSALLALYDQPADLPDADYLALSDRWRPYRTWVAVLARMAGAQAASD